MDEQPIVTLGEIAAFLRVSKKKARKILARAHIPLIQAYRPTLAVFASDLLEGLRLQGIKRPTKGPETTLIGPD